MRSVSTIPSSGRQLLLYGALLAAALMLPGNANSAGSRLQGPCDIYGAAGTPCVAAHSTTRALYAAYNGPLYQVKRQSDGRLLDIGILKAAGTADAPAQDRFCRNTLCVITRIYDQSGKGNHLYQAPPGPLYPGPSKGAFDTQPIADMAPISIGGRKAYGVFIMPGMGFRNNGAVGIATGDEPEGIYYVVDGSHYDSGCCFDYGNSSTNSRAVGTGTMETVYFGNAMGWGTGAGKGPWIMADLEAGLFSGYNARQNSADPSIDSWRFVTAVMDGGGGNKWDLRGGDAQKGGLTTFYSGVRPGSRENAAYFPMHKQGAIELGTGGDNGNGSSGTFYEGVMTAGYPSEATTDAVQANIVAAKYDVPPLALSRLTSFTPGSVKEMTASFTNITGAAVHGIALAVFLPPGWSARAVGPVHFPGPVAPGASVQATFQVASPIRASAGFLTARATWNGGADTATQRLRSAPAIKLNEVRFASGGNAGDQFIELYNASSNAVDISGWHIAYTPIQWATVPLATMPKGTTLAPHSFYLLGLSPSGLAAPAKAGAKTMLVRSTAGLAAGQQIGIEGENRTITNVGTAATTATTIFIPLSTGPWATIPAGATNIQVASAAGFEAGQKIGIDLGGRYEEATVTSVGKAATQTTLAANAVAGATNLKLMALADITAGDSLIIGAGAHKETVKVVAVGTQGTSGSGVTLAAPVRLDHATGADVSDTGTGISFTPATKFAHVSGDAVQALGSGLTLDRPLTQTHFQGAGVTNPQAAMAGYQGPAPNQWFGTLLSIKGGSLALTDAGGKVVADALVWGSQQSSSSAGGSITSPELATLEGVQGGGGCIVVVPGAGSGPGAAATAGAAAASGAPSRSIGRFPDGHDSDSNCHDFMVQPATNLPEGAAAGDSNLKVAGVSDFAVGQSVMIDSGTKSETAIIAAIGTAGATHLAATSEAGATVLPIAAAGGFAPGQTVTIDRGDNRETAVVVAAGGGRGGARLTVTAPLKLAHAAGAQVFGSGITLRAPLTKAHESGAAMVTNLPTPGRANKFAGAQ
ncbi:MAG: lamin tail domain-containing protein [Alphaproteobacteria bacterium]|nr:lamin tail domain-containing protein [Alphaproteobacteria bacterium]